MTCAEYRTLLAAARDALHSLQLGGKLKMLQHGDKRMEWTAGNLNDLRAYIASLQARVDACDGNSRANRVLRFTPTDG